MNEIKVDQIIQVASKVFLNKDTQLKLALIGVLSRGHILIEDTPGVGKTTLVYLLGRLLGININRIQFTNDMLPADIIGTSIFDKEKGAFVFKRGPLFGQFVLTDELNRATSKTQSALLQVMEERCVSIDGNEYVMDDHFLIMATQNPFQQIGTYQLPESQLDRFFIGLTLGFPERSYEKKIIRQEDIRKSIQKLEPLVSPDQLIQWQNDTVNVRLSDGFSIILWIYWNMDGRRLKKEGFSLLVRDVILPWRPRPVLLLLNVIMLFLKMCRKLLRPC